MARHRVTVRRAVQLTAAPHPGTMLRYGIAVTALLVLALIACTLLVAAVVNPIGREVAAACGPSVTQVAGVSEAASAPDHTARTPTGAALPPARIAQVAAGAGFAGSDLVVAVAIALAESGGRPDADNAGLNRDGSIDYGLWQVNSVHTASGFDPSRAFDPAYNAEWARRVFVNAGGNWTPWVTYNTGDYQRHLAAARAAVGANPRVAEALAETALASGGPDAALGEPLSCDTVRGGEAIVALTRTAGSTGPITSAELDDIAAAIGAPVPAYSVLRDATAYGDGTGGPSVNMLAPQMKIAVAQLELLMGTRLLVTSGYRTAAYQAQLCTRVRGPCAAPGRSMHQRGLAVDARNWHQALPYLSQVGLCQPLPSTDAVHLSHVDGSECR